VHDLRVVYRLPASRMRDAASRAATGGGSGKGGAGSGGAHGAVRSLALTPDNQYVFAGMEDGTMLVCTDPKIKLFQVCTDSCWSQNPFRPGPARPGHTAIKEMANGNP
jgi:hypothetical protein